MSKTYKVEGNVAELVKQYFWLAYAACGDPAGMGIFQARSSVTPDEVLNNVRTDGDYPGNRNKDNGEYYGDYVFGSMMKTGIKVVDDTVVISDDEPRGDYQGWSGKYKTYGALLAAAAKEAEVKIIEVPE